ncbi:hypothetical protein Cgig2_028121 [Carnegiea gigantea]|uniref:ENTH domain-containing protein n=1 Tax=Carnegiea gigantea TaxID=171969 RepID=A0A9Q1QLA9_9CARY|nr:hypothetical protein Cgig2_028121 [Carnegiea gigantea]
MGTFQSFRKAYGALKDSTTVGLAKVNSEFKDLDIAVVKATNHVEAPPKERHVRKIFAATSVVRARGDVAYCIHALSRRLSKTRNWIVALKVLIVIHRTLREGDPSFKEELLVYSHKGHIRQISNFKDDSSPEAWDCSAWVRTYALYLEERLECYRALKYDIEAERLTRSSPGASKPEGAACTNYLIQYALALVLKESFKIYCAINDGIINLVDMFFDMSKHDAIKALDVYKRAGQQAEYLADFYEFCKRLDLARNFQFPTLRQPPPSFLATMEEYVKEAPPNGSISKKMDFDKREGSLNKEEKPEESEQKLEKEAEEEKPKEDKRKEPPKPEAEPRAESPPLISTDDLLGLNEVNPKATEVEESNALALAIRDLTTLFISCLKFLKWLDERRGQNQSSTSSDLMDLGTSGSGWELALVTTPSNNNITSTQQSTSGAGFDKLFLDSLYEDESARRRLQMQNAGYGPLGMGMGAGTMQASNPFEQDPFFMPNGVTPPTNVQMALLGQQQQQQQHQQRQMMMMLAQQSPLMIRFSPQSMMVVPYQDPPPPQIQYPQLQQSMGMGVGLGMGVSTGVGMGTDGGMSNPFGEPFSLYPQNSTTQHGNPSLL